MSNKKQEWGYWAKIGIGARRNQDEHFWPKVKKMLSMVLVTIKAWY
jgi:hypothetical protein